MNSDRQKLPCVMLLLVAWQWLSPCASMAAAQPSDYSVTTRLNMELRATPALRDGDEMVNTTHGIVCLRGNVASFGDKWRAEELCRQIDGVVDVKNDLSVLRGSLVQRSTEAILH